MAHKEHNREMVQEEVEVVELFDENGKSLVFELLSTIEDNGNSYFVLTPFIEDESKVNPEVPAEVFVMQQVIKDGGEKMLEPISDTTLVEKIFNIFKNKTKDKFDFADNESKGKNLVTGKVKWFNSEKGYGFIETKDGEDVFVHFSGIIPDSNGMRTLSEGDDVVFEIQEVDNGKQAINVKTVAQLGAERKKEIQELNGNSKQPMIEKEKIVLTNTAHSPLPAQVEQVIPCTQIKEKKSNRPKYEDDLDYLIQDVDIFEKELEAILVIADGIINNTSKFDRIFNIHKRKKLVEAYLKKVQCLQKLNKYRESEVFINELLELKRNMPEALVRLGIIQAENKEYDKAFENCDKAINQGCAYALLVKAFYLENLNKSEEAVELLTEAIHIKPNYANAFWNRSYSYLRLNQYEKAIKDCKRVIFLNPQCTAPYDNWENALDNLKSKENFDYESARKEFFTEYKKFNIYEQLHISTFKSEIPETDYQQISKVFGQAVDIYFLHWKDTSEAEKHLLTSMLEYLYKEAPDDEQNLFMIIELIDAGIDDRKNTDDEFESDLDRLYNLLREKDEKHIALQHYDKFKELAGRDEQKILKTSRQHFPAIGNWKNIFKYARDKNDVEMLAVLIMRTFGTYAIDRGIDLNPEVIEFADNLKNKYEKFSELEVAMRYYDFDFQSKEINEYKKFCKGCDYDSTFTDELFNFKYLLPPNKQEQLNKALVRASLAQVMARNLSHNIGSHVLSHLSGDEIYSQLEEKIKVNTYVSIVNIDEKFLKPNPQLAYFNQYVKNRMAYLSEVTYGVSNTVASKKMYSDVFLELDRVRLLLNHISGKTEFKYEIQLKYTEKNGTNYNLSKLKDISVAFPSDMTGCQAFYNIIENIIRNTAKHSIVSYNKDTGNKITFTIHINEILQDEQNKPKDYQEYYRVEIDDGIQNDKIKEAVIKMNKILEERATDDRNNLRNHGLGCLEMESSAAFLRQISDVEYEMQKIKIPPKENENTEIRALFTDINKQIEGAEPEKRLTDTDINLKIGGVLNKNKNEEYVPLLEAFSTENNSLAYRFYIKKPQEFLFVGEWHIEDEAKNKLLNQGILIKTKGELLGELENNISFAHRFVVSSISEKDFFAEEKNRKQENKMQTPNIKKTNPKKFDYKALLPNRWVYVKDDDISKIKNLITATDFDIIGLEAKVWELYLGKSLLDKISLRNGADIDRMENIELKDNQIVLIDHSAKKYNDFISEKQKNPSIHTWIEILSSNAQAKLPFIRRSNNLSQYKNKVNENKFDDNNISIIIKGQLWDSYSSKILVVEDRVQTYSKTEITVDNNKYSVNEILQNSGVFITKEDLNKINPNAELIKTINDEIDTIKPKFVLIHFSILENVFGDYYKNKPTIDKCLNNWVEDKGCIVVVTSGRGRHTINLPKYVRFLNMSSVSYAFIENRNKYSINYILNQARY